MDLTPGSTFAGYEIRSEIGRGAMGIVYLAYDPKLDREVALKVVAEHLAQDADFRSRFIQEARSAARVEHPGVVAIYETGVFDDVPFLAMRVIRGRELSEVLAERGRFPADEALRILRPVAEGLDAAHSVGIVHRDVKPANILVPDDGSGAVLVDFGIGRVMQGTRATQTGSWVGTVDYVAPEQIRGADVDGRADQYALGCVLYEMLEGRPPFKRDDAIQTMFAHANDAPPSVAGVPASIGEAIDMALAKDPGRRYPTCGALISGAAGGYRPPEKASAAVGPTGTTIGGAVPTNPPGFTAIPADSKATTRSSSRRPVLVGIVVFGVLAMVGGGVALGISGGVIRGSDIGNQATTAASITPECAAARESAISAANELQKVAAGMEADSTSGNWAAYRRQVLDAVGALNECEVVSPQAQALRMAREILNDGLAGMDAVRSKTRTLWATEEECVEYVVILDAMSDAEARDYCRTHRFAARRVNVNYTTKSGASQARAAGTRLQNRAVQDDFLTAKSS